MEQKVNSRQTFMFLCNLEEDFYMIYEYSPKCFLPEMCLAKIIFAFLGFQFVLNVRDHVQVPSSIIQCSAAETKYP